MRTAANVVNKLSKFYKYTAKSVGKRRFTKKDITLFTDTLMTTTDLLTGATELAAKYGSLVLLQNAKSRQKQEVLLTEHEKESMDLRMKGVREMNKKFIELLSGLKASKRWDNSAAAREVERHEEKYGSLILSLGADEANTEKEGKAKATAAGKRKRELSKEETEKEEKKAKTETPKTEKASDKDKKHHHHHHHHHSKDKAEEEALKKVKKLERRREYERMRRAKLREKQEAEKKASLESTSVPTSKKATPNKKDTKNVAEKPE